MKKIRLKLVYKLMASYILIFAIVIIAISVANSIMTNNMDEYFAKRTEESIEGVVSSYENKSLSEMDFLEIESELKKRVGGTGGMLAFYDMNDQILYGVEGKKREIQFRDSQGYDIPERFEEVIYAEKRFDVTYENGEEGYLVIGYHYRGDLNDNDYFLISALKKVNQLIITILIVAGLLVSVIMSRSIIKPIYKVSATANEIRKGNLKARTSVDTSTIEIEELSKSIDYLADTLEKEDMLRRQMTSDMAHEIRTPITTIRNFLEAFIDGVWEANEENMTVCYNELIRLSNLIDKLKDINSIEETTLKVNNERFNLSEEINQITELFRPSFYKKNISLYLNTQANIIMYMDINCLNQILGNIISNAYRYTNEGGHVKISASKDNKHTIIVVEDNGIGISEKDVPYVFERFYRTEKSRNRDTGGMGIGLTIVKKLVEMYNGKISVESEINKGTKFTVVFDNDKIS